MTIQARPESRHILNYNYPVSDLEREVVRMWREAKARNVDFKVRDLATPILGVAMATYDLYVHSLRSTSLALHCVAVDRSLVEDNVMLTRLGELRPYGIRVAFVMEHAPVELNEHTAETCGDYGGETQAWKPCKRKRPFIGKHCPAHVDAEDRAIKALYEDWENDEMAKWRRRLDIADLVPEDEISRFMDGTNV